MQLILSWDLFLFRFINRKWRCSLLDRLMPRMTHLGGLRASILICLALLFFSRETLGKEVVYAMVGSQIVVQAAKKILPRRRPFLTVPETNIWQPLILKDYSFPSGHTAASFSLSAVVALYFPLLTPFVLPLAALIGISRIYLGLHYPSDVIMGALLGTISAVLVCL
ncbi:phosphatase PAP2 family protein [Candidatus Formimonas warabiya]|uniref:phosphatase PAP2 family protein n=1 Tax=Formimonas warabiya TaxID=1761012 RepID=UPI0011D06E12|nr:phosphatase PAP2 family protein [Candidatus Formimonas warabiya]